MSSGSSIRRASVLRMLGQVAEHVAELGAGGVEAREDEHREHVEHLGVGQRPLVERRRAAGTRRGRRPGARPRPAARPAPRPSSRGCPAARWSSARGPPGRRRSRRRSPRPSATKRSASCGGMPMTFRKPSVGKRSANSETKSVAPFGATSSTRRRQSARSIVLGLLHGARREPRVEDPPVLDVVGRVDLGGDEPVDGLGVPRRERLAREDLGRLVDVA